MSACSYVVRVWVNIQMVPVGLVSAVDAPTTGSLNGASVVGLISLGLLLLLSGGHY